MLAEQRRLGAVANALAVGRERRRDELAPAELLQDPGRAQLLLLGDGGEVVHRRGRNPRVAEPGEQHGGRLGGDPLLQQRDQLLAVGDAERVRGEALVAGELRRADRLAGLLEEAVVRRHDHQLAVGRLEHLVRDDQRECGAVPPGGDAAREHVDELVGDERERRLVEREVERPPLALVQRGDDRERRPDAGADVDQRDADPHRVPVGLAGDAHDPRRRLHQRVVARLGGERPAAPEGADRRVDQPRVARPERLRPEAEPLGRAGAQALHRHIRAVGEP